MKELAKEEGVYKVTIEQCMTGLVSPVKKIPMKKTTTFLTNLPTLAKHLRNKRCDGSHSHQVIEGAEGGIKRSVHAQTYPPMLCKLITDAIEEHIMDKFNGPPDTGAANNRAAG